MTQPTSEQLATLLAAMTAAREDAAERALIARLNDAQRQASGEQDAVGLRAADRIYLEALDDAVALAPTAL